MCNLVLLIKLAFIGCANAVEKSLDSIAERYDDVGQAEFVDLPPMACQCALSFE